MFSQALQLCAPDQVESQVAQFVLMVARLQPGGHFSHALLQHRRNLDRLDQGCAWLAEVAACGQQIEEASC